MSTIVCVGDIHVSDRAPASATESYTDDIVTMLKWVADYASEINADAVVWAGDIFHHKSPSRNSHALVLKMIDVVKHHKVPLWCVTGNHDVTNGIIESVREKQPLGVLYESGLNELIGWHPTLPLFGIPWRESWTETGDPAKAVEGWEDSENDPAGSLMVTHAPIYPPKEAENQMFDLVPTMGPDGLSAALGNRGFVYYGHIHEDHGVFDVEGVTYANMGAISRGSLHEYNLSREIKVAVWSPTQGFTEVAVPHKPAAEAFRLVEVTEEREEKMNLETFLADVGSRRLEISSTGTVIEHIKQRDDVPVRIRKKAIEILEAVES